QEPTAPLVVDPGVQRLAALTEPGGLLDPRSGDVAVQRHRDIRFYKRHRGNLPSSRRPATGPLAKTDVPDAETHRSRRQPATPASGPSTRAVATEWAGADARRTGDAP